MIQIKICNTQEEVNIFLEKNAQKITDIVVSPFNREKSFQNRNQLFVYFLVQFKSSIPLRDLKDEIN